MLWKEAVMLISGQQLGEEQAVKFGGCGLRRVDHSSTFIIGWRPRQEGAGWFKRHHGPRTALAGGTQTAATLARALAAAFRCGFRVSGVRAVTVEWCESSVVVGTSPGPV